jgi:lipoprotein-anchoring transpeptidase ErfK/SrfK
MTKKRVISLLLCFLLVMQLSVPAMAADNVSSSWATEALQYGVSMGFLDADDLRGTDNATRAELADMVTRMFDAPLPQSGTTYPGEYADALAKAVTMGILVGDSQGNLNPDNTVTREEAAIMLCRAYGFYGGTTEDLIAFSDADQVDYWAVSAVGYMVRNGYMNGSGGKLRPRDTITRQELAQLLKNLGGTRVSSLEDLPESGTVILTEPVTKLENVSVNGDLIITASSLSLDIRNVQVTGRLVIHSLQSVTVNLAGDDNSIGTLALVCTGGVRLEKTTDACPASIGILTSSATVVGSYDDLYTCVATNIYDGGGDLTVDGTKAVTLSATCRFTSLKITSQSALVTLFGSCETAEITGANVTLNGTGSVDTLIRGNTGSTVAVNTGTVTDTYDPGITSMEITPTYTVDDHGDGTGTVTATFTFSNVDLTGTNGSTARSCTVEWSQDYVSLGEAETVAISNGRSVSRSVEINYDDVGNTLVLAILVKIPGQVRAGYARVPIAEYKASNTVTTIEVAATVKYDTTLYSGYGLSKAIGTVAKGTVCVYDDYYSTVAGRIRLSDGRTGWVRYDALNISSENYVQYTDYTTATKEKFVNDKGYSSTTAMLVWISLKTQKVNVFYGSQGNWRLYTTFSVCTGKNTTPTIAGVFSYKYKETIWDFGSYYVKPVLVFNGGHAFHSRTYVKSTGALLDPTIGTPASNGCIRMYDSDVLWLEQYMKIGTTVVVY